MKSKYRIGAYFQPLLNDYDNLCIVCRSVMSCLNGNLYPEEDNFYSCVTATYECGVFINRTYRNTLYLLEDKSSCIPPTKYIGSPEHLVGVKKVVHEI